MDLTSDRMIADLKDDKRELLEALENLLAYFATYEDDYGGGIEVFENAREAIDKARKGG